MFIIVIYNIFICFTIHITGVAGIKAKVFTTTMDTIGRHELLGNYVVNIIIMQYD